MAFTKSEIRLARNLFAEAIEKYFGSIWRIPNDGEYKGYSWECKTPVAFDAGIWRLCQTAKVKGAWRAAGKIEAKGDALVFVLFTNPNHEESPLVH